MNIEIHRDGRFVSAMGHRVKDQEGGLRELKRRCLETLTHYDCPPDEIRFLVDPLTAVQVIPPAAEPTAEPEAAEAEAEPERPPTIPARPQPKLAPKGLAKAKPRGKS